MRIIKKNNIKKGVTFVIAVLITSLVILFSAAISNLALKEVVLTQVGRESQIAFYAANSGIECALYHDLKQDVFNPTGNPDTINCAGLDVSVVASPNNFPAVPRTFSVGPFDIQGSCFNIYITKVQVVDTIQTTTESRGKNNCSGGGLTLERALRVVY